MAQRFYLGLFWALVTVVLWSGFLLLSRFGLTHDLVPLDLAALRFSISGAVMLPFLLRWGLKGLTLGQCLFLAVVGGLGFTLFAFHAFTYAPAAHGAILGPGMLPLLTALLAALVLSETPTKEKLFALALVLAGAAALGFESFQSDQQGMILGDLLFLGASFCWACLAIAIRSWNVAPLHGTAVVSVFGAAVYLPLYLLQAEQPFAETAVSTLVIQGLYQGVAAAIVALLAFSLAVRHLGPTTATMITASTPAVVAIMASLLLGEVLTLAIGLGALAVVLGGALSAWADKRARSRLVVPSPVP